MKRIILATLAVFALAMSASALDMGQQFTLRLVGQYPANAADISNTIGIVSINGSSTNQYNAFCVDHDVTVYTNTDYRYKVVPNSLTKDQLNLIAFMARSVTSNMTELQAAGAQEFVWGIVHQPDSGMNLVYDGNRIDVTKSTFGQYLVDPSASLDWVKSTVTNYQRGLDYTQGFELHFVQNTAGSSASQSLALWKFNSDPVVPEPATAALIGLGLGAMGLYRRRTAKK